MILEVQLPVARLDLPVIWSLPVRDRLLLDVARSDVESLDDYKHLRKAQYSKGETVTKMIGLGFDRSDWQQCLP